ncbi:MAG: glutamate--cysteine ligase [Pseudomonadota bacterium]
MTQLVDHIERLIKRNCHLHLSNLNRGLEKESLRVNTDGVLAQSQHPICLGSALTHPSITTDYSEALLEFVTPVINDPVALIDELKNIHHYTYHCLGDEKLWVNSMPCIVEGEDKIPIARYGQSNVAKMKEAYRRGLGHRYGRLMQTIAGIHYNFSMPDEFWDVFLDFKDDADRLQKVSSAYFSLIRNFHRHSWLAVYLFGASPAVCKTFLRGREHDLDEFDAHSFHAPYATSLRLSGLGYSNNAQSGIDIRYNSLDDFVSSLRHAIQQPHPEYESIGTKVNGVYQQLNPNLLQIENEFYAVIRPKRVTRSGESPTAALFERGVQYVEVRSLDLDPFSPQGIDEECVDFMDILLMTCLLQPGDDMCPEQRQQAVDNRANVVMRGRDPELHILDCDNRQTSLKQAATNLIQAMGPVASLLDSVNATSRYSSTLDQQQLKIDDPETTPSARIMQSMRSNEWSFYEFAMDAAERHAEHFNSLPMDAHLKQAMDQQANQSIEDQKNVEAADNLSFDDFLADYFERQDQPLRR